MTTPSQDAQACPACDADPSTAPGLEHEEGTEGRIMTRCPSCGAHVRSITRETGGRWSLSCGDWITADEAVPILAARGDDT